ncbi:3-phenylpropionate dioxygenase, partial [Burkholderia pseudomallei]
MTSSDQTNSGADPVRAYLDRGIRNYWYPVAPSWQVSSAPVGITRLSEQIVLWRDREGNVHA